jgi:ParB family chromosome partitioning protein
MLPDVDTPFAAPDGARTVLPTDCVEPTDPGDARRFSEAALEALAASIRRFGQLQPVVVRRVDDRYRIVCGERRWRAVKLAGLANVWIEECSATEVEALAMRLADNLHHMTLNHAERVAALDQLAELVGVQGLRGTARHLGMDPSWLSRQLGIRGDPVIFPALEAGLLGFGQAAELRRAPVPARKVLLQRILASDGQVSTAQIRSWVAELKSATASSRSAFAAASNAALVDSDHTRRVDALNTLVTELRALGAPSTTQERAALQEIAAITRQLLAGPTRRANMLNPNADAQDKVYRTEIKCLMCGEVAGIRDESGVLYASSPTAIIKRRGQAACGRCAGSLTKGELQVAYRY